MSLKSVRTSLLVVLSSCLCSLAVSLPAVAQGCLEYSIGPQQYCQCSGTGCCDFGCQCHFVGTDCLCSKCQGGPQEPGRTAACDESTAGALSDLGIRSLYRPAYSALRASGASSGAYVDRVVKTGPADRAGLQQGDVIVRVGTTPIGTAAELDRAVAAVPAQPRRSVALAFVREGTLRTVEVEMADSEALLPSARVPFVATVVEERDWSEGGVPHRSSTRRVLHRDGLGREAVERFTSEVPGATRQSALIVDPVRGVRILVADSDRKATVIDGQGPAGNTPKRHAARPRLTERPSQYLGAWTIQGVACEGYRREMVLENAAELGLARGPLVVVSETWVSDLLPVPVLRIDRAPSDTVTVSRMLEVHLGVEPDARVFEVPAGYTVEEHLSPTSLVSLGAGGTNFGH